MRTVRRRSDVLRRGGLLTLLALTLPACAGEDSPVRLADAPSTLTIPATGRGELAALRHESGVTHTVGVDRTDEGTAGAITLRPPLLLDGTWDVEIDGHVAATVTIGEELPLDPETLLSCWTGQGDTRARATTPEGVRCTQSLVLRAALDEGYAAAAELVEKAHRGLGTDRNLWGWYCNIAGDAAATGAVLGGADGRALIRDEPSFCDYSVLHGVGAAAALMNATDPAAEVRAVCAEDRLSNIPPVARTSQCWHGAGTAFARIVRLDLRAGEKLCREAPEEASRLNCIEGLFSFARTYRLRGEDARRDWPGLENDGGRCNALDGSRELVDACYRSSAQTLIHDTASTHPDSADARRVAVSTMRTTCGKSAGEHRTACWSGLGTLIANSLHPDLGDDAELRRWLHVCDDAPDETSAGRCYERAALGILRNDQLVTGLALEDVVALVPDGLRDGLRATLETWSQSLGGRSEGSSNAG